MREQYPFFREEDERTQAVIGEDAVEADLSGKYQKPYAILTQKRLYCKNEAGNFIVPSADLRGAGKKLLPGQNLFLWLSVACMALLVCIALTFLIGCAPHPFIRYIIFYIRWQHYYVLDWSLVSILTQAEGLFVCGGSISAIILIVMKKFKAVNKLILGFAFVELICSVIRFRCWTDWSYEFGSNLLIMLPIISLLSVILSLVGIIQDKRHTAFNINHRTGAFFFNPALYCAAELKHFAALVKALKAGDANGQ